jgi:hypothetical protein
VFVLSTHTNMSPEYLFSVPLNIFYYYVKLFNKREVQKSFEEKMAMEESNKSDKMPRMTGNTIPKKQ